MEHEMSNTYLFLNSIREHQRFVNILLEMSDEEGRIQTTMKELSQRFGKSPSRIYQYIKQINRIDQCIVTYRGLPVRLNYSDLMHNGIFQLLFQCLEKVVKNIDAYSTMNHFQKMEFLGVGRDVVYMLDAYLLTYWEKDSILRSVEEI